MGVAAEILKAPSALEIAVPALVVTIGAVVVRAAMFSTRRRVEHLPLDTIRRAAKPYVDPWPFSAIVAPLLITILLCAMTSDWPTPTVAEPLFGVLVARGLVARFAPGRVIPALTEIGGLAVLFLTQDGSARIATMVVVGVLALLATISRRRALRIR